MKACDQLNPEVIVSSSRSKTGPNSCFSSLVFAPCTVTANYANFYTYEMRQFNHGTPFSVIFLRNHTFAFVFALLLSLILFLYWYSLHIMGYQLHAAGFQLLCCFEGLYFSSYIHLQPWMAAGSPLWVTWDESKEFRNLPCLVSYTCCVRFSLPTVQMKRKHQSNRAYKTIYKVKRLLSAKMLSMFAVYCKISSKR